MAWIDRHAVNTNRDASGRRETVLTQLARVVVALVFIKPYYDFRVVSIYECRGSRSSRFCSQSIKGSAPRASPPTRARQPTKFEVMISAPASKSRYSSHNAEFMGVSVRHTDLTSPALQRRQRALAARSPRPGLKSPPCRPRLR